MQVVLGKHPYTRIKPLALATTLHNAQPLQSQPNGRVCPLGIAGVYNCSIFNRLAKRLRVLPAARNGRFTSGTAVRRFRKRNLLDSRSRYNYNSVRNSKTPSVELFCEAETTGVVVP
jgi:hypothetical protein